MATARDGNRSPRPTRRLRFDGLAVSRPLARTGAGAGPGHSGRRFVVLTGLGVVVLWGVLSLAFRDWRARYRERAEFGATHVAPAIDALAGVAPPGIAPDAWRRTVAETRALLVALTAS